MTASAKLATYGAYGLGGFVVLLVLFLVAKRFRRKKGLENQSKPYSGSKGHTKSVKDYTYTAVPTQRTSTQRTERRREDDSDDPKNIRPIEKSEMMEEHHKVDESEEECNVTGDQSTLKKK